MILLKDEYPEMGNHLESLKQGWRVSFPVLKVGIANIRNGRRYSEIKRDGYSTPHTILPLSGKLYPSLFKTISNNTHFVLINQDEVQKCVLRVKTMKTFLLNAFSLQMVDVPCSVHFEEVDVLPDGCLFIGTEISVKSW